MQFLDKVKNKVNDVTFQVESALAIGAMTVLSPIENVFADTKIDTNIPKVNNDGSVTLKGGTNGDPKQSVTKFIGEAQFWLGIITTIVGLSIIGWGIWYSKKAAKEIQEGNSNGYKSAGNVFVGTLIGGGLIAVVGLVLGFGAAFGLKFF